MPFPRASGILLHPTCFPGRFGIGDLGPEAYRFMDYLVAAGQQLWQILPLGPVGHGNSPYMTYAAMAGYPLLISPEILRDQGLLAESDFADLPSFPLDRVDFELVIQTKMPLLQRAFENFRQRGADQPAFEEFCRANNSWLEDYAFFMAYKEAHGGQSWHLWEEAIATRRPEALAQWQEKLKDEIDFQKFLQYQFFQQWSNLKRYANERNVQIIGDIPIYVGHDSVDVWAHPENFYLDPETREPELMAGVPPDYFSDTGQLWGNPIYKWKKMERNGYQWWAERLQATLDCVDIVRIDHFRGLEAFWIVEQGEVNAIRGAWLKGPAEKFFEAVEKRLGRLPLIAEDLGVITPEVDEMRDAFELPGMKVLQFAFGPGRDDRFFPTNYPDANCIVYTGTHDNDTTVGWFNKLPEEIQESILTGLDHLSEEVVEIRKNGVEWAFIWLAWQSIANQAIIPLQDLLGLDSDARMNIPSFPEGNWGWRYRAEMLTEELSDRLRTLTATTQRTPDSDQSQPYPSPVAPPDWGKEKEKDS